MRATLILLNSYFWRTKYGPILAFIFPTLLLAILGNIMRIEYVLPGIVSMTTLLIGIQTMPLGMMEVKNSTLLKYIGSTPVNPKRFTLSTILFYILIIFISISLLLFMGAFIFYKKVFTEIPKNGLYSGISTPFGSFSFFIANIIHMVLSLSIGITIAVFSKTPQQALTISLIILIPSMFLSGMVLSVDIIAQSTTMQWISRLVPFRYTTGNIVVAMTAENQIGNLMDLLSLENKRLIFNIVGYEDKPGHIIWLINTHTDGLILSADKHSLIKVSDLPPVSLTETRKQAFETINGELKETWTFKPSFFKNYIGDHKYTAEDIAQIYAANNWDSIKNKSEFSTLFNSSDSTLFKNIFLKNEEVASADNNMFLWTKSFGVRKIPSIAAIKKFIEVFFKGESNSPSRFVYIWDNFILKNNYSFLNLFMKQNVVLYTLAERILNTLLPLTIIGVLTKVSISNFKWTAR